MGNTTVAEEFPKEEHEAREKRGRELAARALTRIKQVGRRWFVPSQTTPDATTGYLVDLVESRCTCLDYETRRIKCKHVHAVEFRIIWEDNGDGTVTETMSVRRTYPQDWPSYNRAQVHEQEHVEALLAGLCDGIVQPVQVTGRPRLPLRDLVFSSVLKVYGGMSGRRSQTDLRNAQARGLIEVVPSYNTLFRGFEDRRLTPVLKKLIAESALPLATVERQFSIDSTGFSASTYARWFDEKWGDARKRHEFVKLHAMVGTLTNVVTSADVNTTGDSPMLEPLLDATYNAGFKLEELSADKAYLSKRNVELIRAVGAVPYIPFKENSTGKGPEMWRQMFAMFMLKRPEFLTHYHRRSNVETTFQMIKAKFGGAIRSKLEVAQTNEVLCKVLAHNLCCLVSSFYETGIKPAFWPEPSTTLRLVQS